jgi:hypothetical protein
MFTNAIGVGSSPHVVASALFHGAVLLLAAASPRARPTRAEQVDAMRPYLVALENRSRSEGHVISDGAGRGEGSEVNDANGDGVAGGGDRHDEREGAAGAVLSRTTERRRWSARRRAPSEGKEWDGKAGGASDFGIIGMLGRNGSLPMFSAGDRAPRSADAITAEGSMWARALGESPGGAALGTTGDGIGGGGTGAGIGLDHIGDLGHTDGPPGMGMGGKGAPLDGLIGMSDWGDDGAARGPGVWGTRGPWVGCGGSVGISGRIPPQTIQRIVRQNFGRFRLCYERGLLKNPLLAGRVTTRFYITPKGHVVAPTNDGADLPDADVVSCVTRAYSDLVFPRDPGDSVVTVVYPIAFSPE